VELWLESLDGGEWLVARPTGKDHPVLIKDELGLAPEPIWTQWRNINLRPGRGSESRRIILMLKNRDVEHYLLNLLWKKNKY
jgi:hypothetical protein